MPLISVLFTLHKMIRVRELYLMELISLETEDTILRPHIPSVAHENVFICSKIRKKK